MFALVFALMFGGGADQSAAASEPVVIQDAVFVSTDIPASGLFFRIIIKNSSMESDELVSVFMPVATQIEVRTDGSLLARGEPVSLPVIIPAASDGKIGEVPLGVSVTGGKGKRSPANFRDWPDGIPVILRFARSGEISVIARQVSPR